MFKRFDRHWNVSKNKTIEVEGYMGQEFGFSIHPRLLMFGYDHPGFSVEISFWYTLALTFHDNRHWDVIQEDRDRARVKRKDSHDTSRKS